MSDLLSEDRTRAALAEAAAAQLALVQPPGVAVARRTVRRRRTATVTGVAAAAVVALTGGFAFLPAGTPSAPDPAQRPDQSVAPDPQRLSDLAITALKQAVPDLEARTMSGGSGGMESNVMNVDETVTASAYVLAMACVGPGRVDISWQIGTASIAQQVLCGTTVEEAAIRVVELSLQRPAGAEDMTMVFEPDTAAMGKVGFAYRILSP